MTTRTSAGYSRRVLMHRAGAATASVALFALAGMHAACGALAHRLGTATVVAVLAGRAGDVRLERMKRVALVPGPGAIPAGLLHRCLATI